MKIKSISRHGLLVLGLACAFSGSLFAAPITISVDVDNPNNDVKQNINLSTLLPIAEENSWTYDLETNAGGPSNNTKEVVARVGARERVGGGCMRLNPVVFGGELILYLGNYEDFLSLHGIYISRWKGLEDVLMKWETRKRVEWLDFHNRYVSEEVTPIDANSCQDTGRGRVERVGLVLLEDLTENLGEGGNRRGDINCKVKNTDLRENFAGGQRGTGLATVNGASKSLTWVVDSYSITENSGEANIVMDFRPIIGGSTTDYSMHFDITLNNGAITELWITDDGTNTVDDVDDLYYSMTNKRTPVRTNELTPGGSCPEDGSVLYLLLVMCLGLAVPRKFNPSVA